MGGIGCTRIVGGTGSGGRYRALKRRQKDAKGVVHELNGDTGRCMSFQVQTKVGSRYGGRSARGVHWSGAPVSEGGASPQPVSMSSLGRELRLLCSPSGQGRD